MKKSRRKKKSPFRFCICAVKPNLPVYYDKTYLAVPEKGGEKAFELLRAVLMAEQKIAIGKTVMGTKDTLMAIIPREDGILISTMFYADDIKELPRSTPSRIFPIRS